MDDGGRLGVPKFTAPEPEAPDLDSIAADLGEVYFIEKDAKSERERLRGEFFKAATATFSPKRLAQKTVIPPSDIQAQGEDSARAYAAQYNPGWAVIESEENDKGGMWTVLIREDPDYKPYQIVVEIEDGVTDREGVSHPGYVVSRSISTGSPMLDTERLQAVDFDLYLRVTVVENYDLLYQMLYQAGTDRGLIDKHLDESTMPRVPRHPDDLSAEDAEAIREFSFEGPKPTPKLLIRYAKEEEVGEG
jgi:hypothetical protein